MYESAINFSAIIVIVKIPQSPVTLNTLRAPARNIKNLLGQPPLILRPKQYQTIFSMRF